MKRAVSVAAALALLGGVACVLVLDDSDKVVTLKGEIGSEKAEFFKDPEVVKALKDEGLRVESYPMGSLTMIGKNLKDDYDFAFPANYEIAKKISDDAQISQALNSPFSSPMVVLAHRPAAELLKANGLAAQDAATNVWSLNMNSYLTELGRGRSWPDLAGWKADQGLGRSNIIITTTDPLSSSSGSTYIALLSYLLNGYNPVHSDAEATAVLPTLRLATKQQGAQKGTTEELLNDFRRSSNSLVFTYESEATELQDPDTVVLYPDTAYQTDHTIVAKNSQGEKLANLLKDNRRLQELETKHGFRNKSTPTWNAEPTRKGPVFMSNPTANAMKSPPESQWLKVLSTKAKEDR
ncbi:MULTISPECIES: substrate-binding domain-containing protein [Streptomycetaceae]|uniref:substrate-binding domain-containing protein n=1 Tax=Streptomycetaceae TaxID=2062 RepID=UPI0009A13F06|nr:substrate-binding domain-containing protein [Streptomyces sp. CB02056]